MSTPVGGVGQTPTFRGQSGYKRNVLGNPTSVPRAQTTFRGAKNTPGSNVKAPSIRASYNRQDKGTNVTIPQSRLVPWDALRNVGRISPGDVVLTARENAGGALRADGAAGAPRRHRLDEPQAGQGRAGRGAARVVPRRDGAARRGHDGAVRPHRRQRRRRVRVPILRQWAVDGVVLSNDEPGIFSGSGSHDAQLFNLAVQGTATVNNGYQDFSGKGLIDSRHYAVGDSYGKANFDYGMKNDPFYNRTGLQMFDRKIRTLVNLVRSGSSPPRASSPPRCAPSLRSARRRPGWTPRRPRCSSRACAPFTRSSTPTSPSASCRPPRERRAVAVDRQLGRLGARLERPACRSTEPPARKARTHLSEGGSDPYCGMSRKQRRAVGAWRIGKVLDIAARTREPHISGPIDTAEAVTVDVCIEWVDWRALRRQSDNLSIGMRSRCALQWIDGGEPGVEADDGTLFLWPSEYQPTAVYRRAPGFPLNQGIVDDGTGVATNGPVNPTTYDERRRAPPRGRDRPYPDRTIYETSLRNPARQRPPRALALRARRTRRRRTARSWRCCRAGRARRASAASGRGGCKPRPTAPRGHAAYPHAHPRLQRRGAPNAPRRRSAAPSRRAHQRRGTGSTLPPTGARGLRADFLSAVQQGAPFNPVRPGPLGGQTAGRRPRRAREIQLAMGIIEQGEDPIEDLDAEAPISPTTPSTNPEEEAERRQRRYRFAEQLFEAIDGYQRRQASATQAPPILLAGEVIANPATATFPRTRSATS